MNKDKYQKKILIIEDEEKILSVIEAYLNDQGYFVLTASNGKEAFKLMKMYNFSLIILDLMLPDISGEKICKEIRKASRIPIIMLTAKSSEDDKVSGFNLGADDYVTKPFSPRELLARIEAIFKRCSNDFVPLSTLIEIKNHNLIIDTEKKQLKINDKEVYLTKTEYNILITLLSHPGRIFSREELIKYALGNEESPFDRTIDSHIKNIRKKIDIKVGKPSLIKTVRGYGYTFKEDL